MRLARLFPPFVRRPVCALVVSAIPELRGVRKVILQAARGKRNDFQRSCDEVFLQRLATNPLPLRSSFWEDHFEWKAAAATQELTGRILDFGCGSGHSDIQLARAGRIVHGVDASPIGIAIAEHAVGRESAEVRARVSFSVTDVTQDLPPADRFDSAWSSHVFEHIADPGPVLRGLTPWVKPGGMMLISVPLGSAYDDPGHVNHFFDEGGMRAFLEPHIHVLRVAIDPVFQVIQTIVRF